MSLAAACNGHLVATPTPPAPDPCGLVSSAEIGSALATKPSSGTRTGPVHDEESKADVSSCSHTLGEMYFATAPSGAPMPMARSGSCGRGKYMLNVTLAGQVGDGAKYREQLKRLASSALGKL